MRNQEGQVVPKRIALIALVTTSSFYHWTQPCNCPIKSACRSFSCYGAMSLDPPTYLSSLQNNIRARPIPWEGAVRAGTITDNDLKTIKAVDKVRKEQRRQTVESDVEIYQSLILGGTKGKSVLESASKRADVIQYMLVLTGDLINGNVSLSLSLLSKVELIGRFRCSYPSFQASRTPRAV